MWTLASVRKAFLDFFAAKNHLIVPSAPLVNKNDPTLFFTNAGMNPFKDVFMGFQDPPAPRVADTQKCLRVSGKHNDLEEVGHDTYHHTFFEMLGNWSFGDYFKAEAIAWAWELLTQVYKLPPEKLYATVFGGDEQWKLPKDEEAYELWRQYLPAERIRFFGRKDNFWEMGDTGPCGPCTEIHIDLRPDAKDSATPLLNSGNPLVIELWNLVFIQYNRRADGSLEPLPLKSVDTGMGLERLTMVLQGKTSTYDIDVLEKVRREVERLSGKVYGAHARSDVAIRVITDHIRAIAFAIADGQIPSNTGAGYVLRRILRRALRYGYQYLDLHSPFLHKLVPTLAQLYADIFPELQQQSESVSRIIEGEEESFLRTLGRGIQKLEQYLQQHKDSHTLPGEVAFELYDTYGFPLDLTQLILRERDMTVDTEGFERALNQQKERSRQATQKSWGDWVEFYEGEHSHFMGYDAYEVRARIMRVREVQEAGGKIRYHLVLDQTPFYPEGGGQVSDTGYLQREKDRIFIEAVYREQDSIIHVASQLPRDLEGEWFATIDIPRREIISRHHTATHLLHAALREILGTHVRQSGSLVAPDRLRFDFTHPQRLSSEEIQAIEELVNTKISSALIRKEYRSIAYEEAIRMGALAFFGEKYGEKVRMIEFGGKFSRELCGGTHAQNTLELRFFKILSESASAAGVRRIEAVVAQAYQQWVESRLKELHDMKSLLKNPPQPIRALEKMLQTLEETQENLRRWQQVYARMLLAQWQKEGLTLPGVIVREIALPESTSLREFAGALQQLSPQSTFILLVRQGDSTEIGICAPNQANTLFQTLAEKLGAKGGGNARLAVGKLSRPAPPIQEIEQIVSLTLHS
ncbi:MAG: alanine--tRNA ligase [Bacteroidia bacterium]|nr:alanine--tRNA ligase [Bacteroidia bacterium]MDW8235703.1 alanine--tRNA ligase [Bacteroidia bacterium]